MPLRKKFFGKRHFIKYGNTSVLSEYRGIKGEITYDTTKNVLVVHDGKTAGGFAMANSSSSGATAYANAVSYVDTKISELVDGAPDLLNTLNEIAAAINDDANFITTIGTNITSNSATAYSNAVSYTDTAIGTANTAMAANAATAYTNAVSYADTIAGTAYSNATFYADTIAGVAYTNSVFYTDTAIGTANTAMAANAATAYSNATFYADTIAGVAYTNSVIYTDTAIGTAIGTANTAMAANAATAYSNAVSYADTIAGTAYSNAVSYTDTAINNLVDSAPGVLDTLNELASALGDDANFSTTITNSLATKAPTVDPTFTGNATFDTSTLFVDGTTNYVGIGNTTPQSKLYVYSAGSENFVTFENANNNFAYIDLVTPDHASYWGTGTALGVGGDADVAFGTTLSANLIFLTNNSERMRIDSAGNLEVNGVLTASGLTYPSSDGTNGQLLTTNGSGTLSFTDKNVEIFEAKTSATSTVTHDLNTAAVFRHTSISANFTANFTNADTTNDRTTSVALILVQGGTARMPTAVQIDGAAQTILWQGGSAPSGTANGTDVVSFTLIRSGSAWTVIGSATSYS